MQLLGNFNFLTLSHFSIFLNFILQRCLRCLSVAVPSQLTPTIDLCLDGLENLRRSPEAIYGYSAALASLLGAVR